MVTGPAQCLWPYGRLKVRTGSDWLGGAGGSACLRMHRDDSSPYISISTTTPFLQLFTHLSLHCQTPPSLYKMASIRSFASASRALSRNVLTRPTRAALPLIATRSYRQPTRDPMTGEVIQLPDIDVSGPRASYDCTDHRRLW